MNSSKRVDAGKIVFPGISFWNMNAPLVALVNPGDFERDGLLGKLGISGSMLCRTFGTKDRNEVIRRQRTVKFLTEHPYVGKYLAESMAAFNRYSMFPSDGQEFLNSLWVDPAIGHNRFFGLISGLLKEFAKAGELPTEIQEFRDFLTSTYSTAELAELDLGSAMGAEIQKAAAFQGTLLIGIEAGHYRSRSRNDWKVCGSTMYGYQKYSYDLSGYCDHAKRPGWLDHPISRFLMADRMVDYILRKLIDEPGERAQFNDLLITEMPEELRRDLLGFAYDKLAEGTKDLNERDDGYLELYFNYNNGKLKAQLVQFYSCVSERWKNNEYGKDREKEARCNAPAISDKYLGFTKRQVRRIAQKNEEMGKSVAQVARQTKFSLSLLKFVQEAAPELLTTGVVVAASSLEKRFQWHSIQGLRHDERFAESCNGLAKYRDFVVGKVKELYEISAVVSRMIEMSIEWKLPLCFPKILSDTDHLVSFDSLLPVHLIGRKVGDKEIKAEDLVPISSLAPLNGQMIGLTGQNAGGKTVTEEAIVGAIYLAQSGLPVFGVNVALNVKSAIGMVFLERGQGSTLELMLTKTRNVIEAVQRSEGNSIVVFLDEIGTGTQEASGLELGERILATFKKSGCSIVFSTQITELARMAEKDMDAICYQIDMRHRIQSGIGTGQANLLAERVGISRLLEPASNN